MTISNSTAETNKHIHHFVPVRLIKRFTLPGTDPFLYVPAEDKIVPASPQKIFAIKDFHAVPQGDGSTDYNTIEDLFNEIETSGSTAIEAFSTAGQISEEERYFISRFWALQYLRTPLIRSGIEGFLKEIIKITGDIAMDREDAPPIPDSLKKFGKTFSEIAENGGVNIKIATHMSMAVLKGLPKVMEDIYQMNWCLMDSEDEDYFILSDNPCAFYDRYYLKHAYGVGTRNVGLELTMPIGKNQCMLASWGNMPSRAAATFKQVVEINRRAALFGDKFFAYPIESKTILKFIKKYSTNRPEMDIQTLPTARGKMVLSRANTFRGEAARRLFSNCKPLFKYEAGSTSP